MSLKLSPLLVAVSFGAFGALHGLEKGPEPEPLPIVPPGHNAQIKLVPGSSNPITEEITLEPDESAGTVEISIASGDMDLGGVRISGGTIHIDDDWSSQNGPGVYLDGNPLNTINLSGHFKTIVDNANDSSSAYPFPNFYVAIRQTDYGYDLYILYSNNGIRIEIRA